MYLVRYQTVPNQYNDLYRRIRDFPGGTSGKESACQCRWLRDMGLIPGWEDPLEKGMATRSSILVWRIPRTEEHGGLQSIVSQRVGQLKQLSIRTQDNQFSSVLVMSDPLQHHRLQHTRLPCPSLTPRVYSNSCASNQRCHPTISSAVVPFYSCLHYFPASGSFLVSQFFASGGQSIGVSALASVLPMKIQDWFPHQCPSISEKELAAILLPFKCFS